MTNQALENRIKIEKRIIKRIVTDALEAGFALNVDNGGDDEELTHPTTDRKEILDAMMQCDEDRLNFYKPSISDPNQFHNFGWVYLVYGNGGWDVMSDYTVNLESVLEPANKLARSLEN